MNFFQRYWWMTYQARGVFTVFWIPSVLVTLLVLGSFFFSKGSNTERLSIFLWRFAVLLIPALLILGVGTIWDHWELYKVDSSLSNWLVWSILALQIFLFAFEFFRSKSNRVLTISAASVAFWCSYAAYFVSQMAIRYSWP